MYGLIIFFLGIFYGVLGFQLILKTTDQFFERAEIILGVNNVDSRALETILDFVFITVWPFYYLFAFVANSLKLGD